MIIGTHAAPRPGRGGAVAAVAGLEAQPASAQLFWDWGGGSTVGGSGREIVRFSPQFGKGQIIVSFGDRRLYYVTKPGEAHQLSDRHSARAEPLAGRHHRHPEARQPVLDADADHDRRESAPAALGAGRASHEPAGRARALSGIQHLSHPRHRCALDHRHGRLQGLHPHVQPGCAGPLSARPGRRQGDGDLPALRRRRRRQQRQRVAAAATASACSAATTRRRSRASA